MIIKCSRCGKRLDTSAPFWHARIEIWADVNRDFTRLVKSDSDIDRELAALLRQIEKRDAQSLEHEVYQKFHFILCNECRLHFAANPLNSPLEDASFGDD